MDGVGNALFMLAFTVVDADLYAGTMALPIAHYGPVVSILNLCNCGGGVIIIGLWSDSPPELLKV